MWLDEFFCLFVDKHTAVVAGFDKVFDFLSHVVKEKVISESSLKSTLARMCASVCQSDSCVLEAVWEDNLFTF